MVSRPLHLRLMTRLSRGLGWSLLGLSLIRLVLLWQKQLIGLGGEGWTIWLMLLMATSLLLGHRWINFALRRLPEADGITYERLLLVGQCVQLGMLLVLYICLQGAVEILLLLAFPAVVAHWLGYPRLSRLLNGAALLGVLAWLPFGYPAMLAMPGLSSLLLLVPVIGIYTHAMRLMGQLSQQARGQVSHLSSLATTDPLTGLMNRRQFSVRLSAELARARRHPMPLSLVLFDLDNFKHVNDQYGHPVGDQLLRELSELITRNIRECDMAARYGGEEFALILPETTRLATYDLMERLRLLVSNTRFCQGVASLSVTLSIGVTQFDPLRHTAVEFVTEADQALYQAKRTGKNKVVVFGVQAPPHRETPASDAKPQAAVDEGEMPSQEAEPASSSNESVGWLTSG